MHILLLTDGISPFVTGGMQRHSANLAKYFTLQGAKVTLAHCVDYNSDLPTENEVNRALFPNSSFRLEAVKSLHFPNKDSLIGHYIRNSHLYSMQLFELFDFSNYDFVYAKGFCGWYYMEQKNKGVKLPPIGVKFHGYEMYQKLSSLPQFLKAYLLRRPTKWNNVNADYVFSYGGKITDLIVDSFNLSKDKIIEFPSGIDNDWVRETELSPFKKPIKFVFVGRNEVRKGVNELKEAINNLINEIDFEFHFIGPIPTNEKIINPNVYYYGELNTKKDIITILDESDVLVCPSHSEGMPNVILEGMARGLAVLATDVGAVELIVDKTNGIIIQPLNQLDLEGAIKEFSFMNPKNLVRMKSNSLEKVKNQYLWDRLAGNIINAIKKLI